MKLKRLSSVFAAGVVAFSSILSVAVIPMASAAANTCTWTGTTDLLFSTATNWSTCGGVAPAAGDILKFPNTTAGTFTLNNDLGLAFGGVVLEGTGTNATTYNVSALTLATGAIVDGSNYYTNTGGFTNVFVGSGPGALVPVTAQGDLTLKGANGTGLIPSAWNVPSGSLTLSSGATLYSSTNIVVNAQSIVVEKGSTFVVDPGSNTAATYSTPITLGGGTGTAKPLVEFDAVCNQQGGQGCISYSATSWTVSSAITLLGDAYVNAGASTTVNVTGALSGPGFALSMDPSSYGTVAINPSSNTSSTSTGNQTAAKVTSTISDSQPSTDISIANNYVTTLDGTRGNVTVNSGGTLMGSGTAGTLFVLSGGTVAPGHSPGCLNTSALTILGNYDVELGGTDPCTGYDQIKVTGTVDVTGGTLNTTLYNSFKPAKGQTYTIIDNDVADAVTGTFTGLAEGATFTVDGYVFAISYVGGDGNDVVLTVQNVPATPDTGFAAISAHPGLTLGVTVLFAGAIFVIAKNNSRKVSVRARR